METDWRRSSVNTSSTAGCFGARLNRPSETVAINFQDFQLPTIHPQLKMAGTAKAATALSMLHTGARSLHKGQLPSPNEGSAGLGLGSVTHITELSDDDFSEGDEDGEFDYAVQASDLMHCVFLFLEPKDIIEASFSCTAWLVAASRVPVDTHFVREDDTLEWWESMVGYRFLTPNPHPHCAYGLLSSGLICFSLLFLLLRKVRASPFLLLQLQLMHPVSHSSVREAMAKGALVSIA